MHFFSAFLGHSWAISSTWSSTSQPPGKNEGSIVHPNDMKLDPIRGAPMTLRDTSVTYYDLRLRDFRYHWASGMDQGPASKCGGGQSWIVWWDLVGSGSIWPQTIHIANPTGPEKYCWDTWNMWEQNGTGNDWPLNHRTMGKWWFNGGLMGSDWIQLPSCWETFFQTTPAGLRDGHRVDLHGAQKAVVSHLLNCKIWVRPKTFGTSSAWWLTYPSEKYESQVGWLFPIDIEK